ncbi:MAG: YceD family protein [Cellvibrio sp.]|uniref:YceD family protein n=1 Tax=Cellvibrio sp. TaxID=1965322 RepID=UPI0031B00453
MFKTPSNKVLPRQGDPRKFAQHGVSLEGVIPVSELPRILDATEDSGSEVQVKLEFTISEEWKKVVIGSANADLALVCQRCLEPVTVPVESNISLAIVWDEEAAKALPERFDPWITGEGMADLYDMIEEELLLSLPAVAYHEEPCLDSKLYSSGKPVEVKREKNPFQVLEQLKSSPKS